MRTELIRTTVHWGLAATITVLAVACGDDSGGSSEVAAPAADDPSESAYCDAAREWAIHELDPFDESDPVAFRAYWEEFLAFEHAALDTAPPELADDWQVKIETEDATINPVLDRYDYDLAEMEARGTPEEAATLEAPPEVQAAQDVIFAYEADVCGAQQPLPAEVSFEGEAPGPYCELVSAEYERVSEVMGSGTEPAAIEALSDELIASGAEIVAAAPEVIADEVAALRDWQAGPQRDALERHDWDFIGLIREGPAQDRADFQQTDPAIRDDYATVAAYEEQVCGA
jgi:hypothetical protein